MQNPSFDNYTIITKIAKGRYSEVFEAIEKETNERCAIKIYPNSRSDTKIEREVKILQKLEGGVNIISMRNVLSDQKTIVLELIENCNNLNNLSGKLTDIEIKYYIRELLKTIEYCHSMGVMHRNIKPKNILIDQKDKKLYLISWSLAEFCNDGVEFNTRLGTRYFKPPELILGNGMYDYSIDIWNLGCVFSKLIFGKEPFSPGRDDWDQLVKIAKVLGKDDLFDYLERYSIQLPSHFDGINLEYPKQLCNNLESDQLKENELALDFLEKFLKYDPKQRITSKEALAHPYLA